MNAVGTLRCYSVRWLLCAVAASACGQNQAASEIGNAEPAASIDTPSTGSGSMRDATGSPTDDVSPQIGGANAAAAVPSGQSSATPGPESQATLTPRQPAAAGAPASSSAGASGTTAPPMEAASPQNPVDAGTAQPADAETTEEQPRQPVPPERFLVAASGPCPEFTNGYVMFAPDGVQRRVLLYVSDAANMLDGPLVFSWHSTLPNPEDATSWLGRDVIDEIMAQGGIVAAPATGYPAARRPWDAIPMGGDGDNDQRLMDEIVACAIDKVGIDVRRIHATGMSAGGLKTAQVSLRRSGYLASVVVYSGGFVEGDMPPDQDPDNHFAAMVLYGGPSDISPVDGINYTEASHRYLDVLRSSGRFAFLCNHDGGHSVPRDSQASAWRFMQDHPYGVSPEPYSLTLPDGFLRYCDLGN